MPGTDAPLSGQAALVTGAGRGLGRAYALELASRGAAVVVSDLPGVDGGVSSADGVAAEIVGRGGEAMAATDRIVTPEGAAALVERTVERFGRLDVLVNNAGILRPSPFEELEDEDLCAVLEVNLMGTLYPTRCAYRAMRDAGYGRIVNISSNVGTFGMAGMVNYGVSKAGVLGLTVSLAQEARGTGVAVNAVLPNARTSISAEHPIAGNTVEEGGPRAYMAWLPERFRPEVAAALVGFLASPECEVSGEAFSVLGGRYARVFTAVTEGWSSPDDATPATAQDVAEHFDEIRLLGRYDLPGSVLGEYEVVHGPLPGSR